MEKYFAKFGIPISVVVIVVIIVVVIVITIITVKSTKEHNNSLTYMVDNTTNEDTYKYISTMDISRNYKKINISDVYTYADNLIKNMVTEIVNDISDEDILKYFYDVLRINDTDIDTHFTNLYNEKDSLIFEKLQENSGASTIIKTPAGTTAPNQQMIISRANSAIQNTKLSTNKSIRVTPESEASEANRYNMHNWENGSDGFLYHQEGEWFGNYLRFGRPFPGMRPHPGIDYKVSIHPDF